MYVHMRLSSLHNSMFIFPSGFVCFYIYTSAYSNSVDVYTLTSINSMDVHVHVCLLQVYVHLSCTCTSGVCTPQAHLGCISTWKCMRTCDSMHAYITCAVSSSSVLRHFVVCERSSTSLLVNDPQKGSESSRFPCCGRRLCEASSLLFYGYTPVILSVCLHAWIRLRMASLVTWMSSELVNEERSKNERRQRDTERERDGFVSKAES